MFGKLRKLKKNSDELGPYLHNQLSSLLEEEESLDMSPEEMAFTSGYIGTFVLDAMSRRGLDNPAQIQDILMHVFNGVIPQRLWEIYQRGLGLYQLAKDFDGSEYKRTVFSYEMGVSMGTKDAESLDSTGQIMGYWFMMLSDGFLQEKLKEEIP